MTTTETEGPKAKNLKNRTVLSTLLSYLSYLCLAVVIAIVGFSGALRVGGVQTMYVVSDSMVPTFQKGDMILMAKDYNSLAVGDIIGYKAAWEDNKIVTHRIIDISGSQITVKGDNNALQDPPFDKSRVQGEIIGIYPKVGYLFDSWGIYGIGIVGVISMFAGDLLRPTPRHLGSGRSLFRSVAARFNKK